MIKMRDRVLEKSPGFSDLPLTEQDFIIQMLLTYESEVTAIATKAWKIQDTQFALMEQLIEFRDKNLCGINEHFRMLRGVEKIRGRN